MLILGLFLLIFIWIKVESSLSKQKIEKEKITFWEKEHQANATRKKDISQLEYIKIPMEDLPFLDTTDEELQYLQNYIKKLSACSILNLTGQSNTDIKLAYGIANFNFLTECDNNFNLLIQTLYKWGKHLYTQQQYTEALAVLEYGVQCKTDLTKHYILTANLYNQLSMSHKIDTLIQQVNVLDTPLKNSTLTELQQIKKYNR